MIYVRFRKLTDTAKTPTFAAGYDLYADTTHKVVVNPGDTVPFYTGIAMEIPDGYCGKIYSRSGLSTIHGIRIANCVAVIDSDYRGPIVVAIKNESNQVQVIDHGERIAQLVVIPYLSVEYNKVDTIGTTARGEGGCGSTGK